MNDFETMKEMLTRSNIEYEIYEYKIYEYHSKSTAPRQYLTVDGGHAGFYTIFKFKEDGTLLSVEAYE